MRPSRRLSAALAGGAVALLVGCSGSEPVVPLAEPEPTASAPSAITTVRAAAAATALQGSSRYLLTTATKVNGQDVVLSGEGIYDWEAGKGRTTYEIPGGKVEQRLLGPDLFFVLPQTAGIFYRVSTADVAATPLGGTVDPTAHLEALAAVESVELVGPEQVRGTPTTRYRGSYDVSKAVNSAVGPERDALLASFGRAQGISDSTYDVWLDRSGLLRRLEQTVEIPASPQTNGQVLTVKTSLELYDFGLDVYVPGPPAQSIRDGAPILAALRNALPKPAAPPAAPPAPPAPASPSAP